jgi:hypothetical protein
MACRYRAVNTLGATALHRQGRAPGRTLYRYWYWLSGAYRQNFRKLSQDAAALGLSGACQSDLDKRCLSSAAWKGTSNFCRHWVGLVSRRWDTGAPLYSVEACRATCCLEVDGAAAGCADCTDVTGPVLIISLRVSCASGMTHVWAFVHEALHDCLLSSRNTHV